MKRILTLLVCSTLAFMPACANLSIPSPDTVKQKIAVAYVSVKTVRDTATTLLKAKKISVDDAENILKQTDNVREGIDIARTLQASGQNTSADNKLANVAAMLEILQSYLATKQ